MYVINFDEYADIGTHWIALYALNNDITCFDSFGVEHLPKEVKKFIRNKNMKTSIHRIKANNSVMCRYFCIGFIDFMLPGKNMIEYTGVFSLYDFKKDGSIILSYFNNGSLNESGTI